MIPRCRVIYRPPSLAVPPCIPRSDLASNGGCGRLDPKNILIMKIQLPEYLESSIREAVQSGQFPSVDDAMAAAARLLLSQLKQRPVTPPPTAGEDPAVAPHKPIWADSRSSPPASPTKCGISCPPTSPSSTTTISTARRSGRSNEACLRRFPVLDRSFAPKGPMARGHPEGQSRPPKCGDRDHTRNVGARQLVRQDGGSGGPFYGCATAATYPDARTNWLAPTKTPEIHRQRAESAGGAGRAARCLLSAGRSIIGYKLCLSAALSHHSPPSTRGTRPDGSIETCQTIHESSAPRSSRRSCHPRRRRP